MESVSVQYKCICVCELYSGLFSAISDLWAWIWFLFGVGHLNFNDLESSHLNHINSRYENFMANLWTLPDLYLLGGAAKFH